MTKKTKREKLNKKDEKIPQTASLLTIWGILAQKMGFEPMRGF